MDNISKILVLLFCAIMNLSNLIYANMTRVQPKYYFPDKNNKCYICQFINDKNISNCSNILCENSDLNYKPVVDRLVTIFVIILFLFILTLNIMLAIRKMLQKYNYFNCERFNDSRLDDQNCKQILLDFKGNLPAYAERVSESYDTNPPPYQK
ncbi:hypothetical protein HZS_5607 [Henneguya salminicola]|nr:hypothetical protein HZS_5607 [Henneguya salminicola]